MTNTALFIPIAVSAISVLALTFVDRFYLAHPSQTPVWRYILKPLAAAAFIALALNCGAFDSDYGQWVLVALGFCMLGDVCLMFKNDRSFLSGLTAFLLGHLFFVVAFLKVAPAFQDYFLISLLLLIVPALSLRWLFPHIPSPMKTPVLCYILVITAMLMTAFITFPEPGGSWRFFGALGFAISDLAVARQQFVKASITNGTWGTPLYFGSQMLLAWSCVFF